MPFASQEARREYARRRYANSMEARRKAAENSAAYRHKSPEGRERWRQWKRNARAKKGATALSLIRERQQDGLAAQNARQAWRWWLKNAPDWWMRGYYRSLGKPWGNPRLSGAVKWRIRYWLDPSFRAREIEKVQTLKEKRAARIKANNDGTLTGNVIVKLFAQARVCPYCTRPMRSVEKSLDHIVPLSRGGAHSVYNVLVCCKTCNSRKAAGPSPLLGSSPLPGSGVIKNPAIWDM